MNPEWGQTFDLPVAGLSSMLLEVVCWDKDRFGKDYMGEFDIALEELFADGQTDREVSQMLPSLFSNLHQTLVKRTQRTEAISMLSDSVSE